MPSDIDHRAIGAFLEQPDAVIFVGSGLSTWSGLPSWERVIRTLIDLAAAKGSPVQIAEEAFAAKQLLEAADALPLSSIEIANALRVNLGFAKARPHEIHALLIKLGPRRFVTTNFDSLIEQELGLQGSLGQFRTVTGRQVAELADIVKANADTFIFKPHGDLADAESLVLTSRAYERIIAGGANLIRRALETILVTRPVLFIGYGLRDPDTNLVLRTLHDRYVGNVGHFAAIVANATEEHQTYWWDRYRIRIYSYSTDPSKKYAQGHFALLQLMRGLVAGRSAARISSKRISENRLPKLLRSRLQAAHDRSALLRYGARLIRPEPADEYPINVAIRDWTRRHHYGWAISRFHNADIRTLLEQSSGSFILSGPAGSGKSYAVALYLSRSGRRIIEWDQERKIGASRPPIPLLLDARLYNGSFSHLAAVGVPSQLNLRLLSQQHSILIIVDSLDEMPAAELDAARWRADFESFVSQFKNSQTIYCTRRADLVGRGDLPVFHIQSLTKAVVENRLSEIGKDVRQLPIEFRQAIQTPFLLAQARRFLVRYSDIRTAPALLAAFMENSLLKLNPSPSLSRNLKTQLTSLAEFLINKGRETISLKNAFPHFKSVMIHTLDEASRLIDGLVDAGIMTSEVDAHVRFVHRTVTEYLAAERLISTWRSNELNLAEKLAYRRWDNAIVWACNTLTPEESAQFVRSVYELDPVLAYRMVATAEIGTPRLWTAFLACAARRPPTDEQAHEIVYSFDEDEDEIEVDIPRSAATKLKLLMQQPEEIGGWAAAHYARYATNAELREWIDRLRRGELGMNYVNISGHSLGERLRGPLLDYFIDAFDIDDLSDRNDAKVSDEEGSRSRVAFSFKAVIPGLPTESLSRVIQNARTKGEVIRSRICSAVHEIEGDEIDRFLLEQVDQGLLPAIWSIGMRLRYWKGKPGSPPTPGYTKKRFKHLLNHAAKNDRSYPWGLMLLRECSKRDRRWARAIEEAAVSNKDVRCRRCMKVLRPKASSFAKERFIYYALNNVHRLNDIELGTLFEIKNDDDFVIDEEPILRSLEKNGRQAIRIIAEFFNTFQNRISLSIFNIDRWVDVINQHSDTDAPDSWICSYLALAYADSGRMQLLRRANNASDPASNFVLGHIIPRMSTVTTDDLTSEATIRLLSLYVDGELEPWPSPGNIASERFISDFVLPMANEVSSDRYRRESIETILHEAGERHDRRYFAPWERS